MRRYCECCERPIHLVVNTRPLHHGIAQPKDHWLCARCRRQLRDRLVAERIGPKPWFAVRSTLRVLDEQAKQGQRP